MNQGKTRYVILGLLTEGALTGYEIKKIIDIRFSFFWNESYGQLYPTLKRLASEGLISSSARDDGSGRGKICYAITPKGENALKDWLKEPVERESVRFEILLKMYFSQRADADVMKRHIAGFMESHQKQLEVLNLFEKELSAIVEVHPDHADVLRVIDFGQKVFQAYIAWCEETIKYLEGRDQSCVKESEKHLS